MRPPPKSRDYLAEAISGIEQRKSGIVWCAPDAGPVHFYPAPERPPQRAVFVRVVKEEPRDDEGIPTMKAEGPQMEGDLRDQEDKEEEQEVERMLCFEAVEEEPSFAVEPALLRAELGPSSAAEVCIRVEAEGIIGVVKQEVVKQVVVKQEAEDAAEPDEMLYQPIQDSACLKSSTALAGPSSSLPTPPPPSPVKVEEVDLPFPFAYPVPLPSPSPSPSLPSQASSPSNPLLLCPTIASTLFAEKKALKTRKKREKRNAGRKEKRQRALLAAEPQGSAGPEEQRSAKKRKTSDTLEDAASG